LKDNDIGDEGIKELAIGVSMNNTLQYLNLEYNQIEHIPSIFLKILKLEIWDQGPTKLKHPPQEIVYQGIDAIKKYYKEFQIEVEIIQKKMILIGEEEVRIIHIEILILIKILSILF
jgi:hypothetical protein